MSDDAFGEPASSNAAVATDADLYESSAQRLEAEDKSADAAIAWYEAGRRHLSENRFERATEALTRARTLDPSHQATCWSLADAWLLRSFMTEPPYADRPVLAQALSAWNAGAALGRPAPSDSWTYLTRALINEQEGRLAPALRTELWWEAVAYLERAILLDASDARRWAYLGRFYRLLEQEWCAVHATAQAMGRDREDAASLEERAAILADVAASDETIELIDRRLEQDPENAWARGVKAFVLMRQRKYAPALAIIEEVIASDPASLWNLDVRALCQRMLGDVAAAHATYEQIWAGRAAVLPNSIDDQRLCAYAGYQLGHIDDVIAILRPLVSEPIEQSLTLRILGMCAFVKGNLMEAERLLLEGLGRANARATEDCLVVDLPDLETIAALLPDPTGATETFTRVRRAAAARLAHLNRETPTDAAVAAVQELTHTLTAAPSTDGSWAGTAALSGLARAQLAAGRWRDAAMAYARLEKSDARFPEASLGVDRALEGVQSAARDQAAQATPDEVDVRYRELLELETLLGRHDRVPDVYAELGEVLWRSGRPDEAREQFERALSTLSPAHGEQRQADLRSRLALAQLQTGDHVAALRGFTEALRRYHDLELQPGETLSSACRPLIRSAAECWSVDAGWQQFMRDASLPIDVRDWFTDARRALLGYLSDSYGLDRSADKTALIPAVTPIALEVGNGLRPHVDPAVDGGKFVFEDIAAMRARIERSIGFAVPGVRVRASGIDGGDYTVLIDEVPVALGSVVPGSRLVAAAPAELAILGIAGEGVVPAGRDSDDRATWCGSNHWPALDSLGLPVLTGTAFMLAHVEAALRRHLDAFLGVQETHALLTKLEKAGTHAAFASSILSAPARTVRLARVLRALVRDQVPIVSWSEIVAALQETGLDDLDAAVDRIRVLVKRELPGNEVSAKSVKMDPLLEERVTHLIGTDGTSAPAPAAHACVVELRVWLESFSEPVTVVTSSASTRGLVRRLLEFEFPEVPVLSRDEALSPPPIVSVDLKVPEKRDV